MALHTVSCLKGALAAVSPAGLDDTMVSDTFSVMKKGHSRGLIHSASSGTNPINTRPKFSKMLQKAGLCDKLILRDAFLYERVRMSY